MINCHRDITILALAILNPDHKTLHKWHKNESNVCLHGSPNKYDQRVPFSETSDSHRCDAASITFNRLWDPAFNRVSIDNHFYLLKMAFGAWTDQSLVFGLWIHCGEPCMSPTPFPCTKQQPLRSCGNSSWLPAIHVVVDIHWVSPSIQNKITSPPLIILPSQECISSWLFPHLPYSWWKKSIPHIAIWC